LIFANVLRAKKILGGRIMVLRISKAKARMEMGKYVFDVISPSRSILLSERWQKLVFMSMV